MAAAQAPSGRSCPLALVGIQDLPSEEPRRFSAFVDTIYGRAKRDSQYQQEVVQDSASHLEHLQAILLEFDADGAPEESDLM